MDVRRWRWTRPEVFFLVVVSVALLLPATDARAITFSTWATAQGWPLGYAAPETVYASSTGIDSLIGIGNYNWTTTPTTILSLSGNWGLDIIPGDFSGLGSLKRLYLSDNLIKSIEPGDFSGLTNLTELNLHRNLLTSIKADDFTGLSSLTRLHLGENRITSIESDDFSGLPNLTTLDLWANEITSIEPGDFSELGGLTCLYLGNNQIASIEKGDFGGLGNLTSLDLGVNRITSIQSGGFSGLDSLTTLSLAANPIARIESGAFSGLDALTELWLSCNQITRIESGAFSGLGRLRSLHLGYNAELADVNLEAADFSSLVEFDVVEATSVTRVSLRNAVLTQMALAAIIDGGGDWSIGIGELPGVTELDLSGVDFAAITDLSPLYMMDNLTDLWLADVRNMSADALDVLLDNLATMEDSGIEGTLYLTPGDFDAFNAAGGGKLSAWDAEPGHHVQIVPEPGGLALLAGLGLMGMINLRRREA